MKRLFFRIFTAAFVFIFFVFTSSTFADEGKINSYDPKSIMTNGNTTIEGGRFGYDSFKLQNNLFKGAYPKNEEKIVFLTFDDGPSLDNTPKVLETLNKYDVKATFFVLGVNLDKGKKYEEMFKRVIEEGHAIANHGYTHNYSYLYPGRVINYENLTSDMKKAHDSMKRILGDDFNTRVLRLPGGLRSWKGQDETLRKLNESGLSVIEWNSLSGDADGKPVRDPNALSSYAIKTAGNSKCVVVLMHDFTGKAGSISADALPTIIEHFKNNGYTFRTIY